jgi:hypothetical protein
MKLTQTKPRINVLSSHFYRELKQAQMHRALTLRKDVMHYKKLQNTRNFELGILMEESK